MTLVYEFAWQLATAHTLRITDPGGTVDITPPLGLYAHTELTERERTYDDLAGELEALIAASALADTYTVSWSRATGYTIASTNALFQLDLTGAAARLAMGRLLGLSGVLSGASSYTSTARPDFVLVPAQQARKRPDEYQPDDIVTEAVTDAGTTSQISRYTSETWADWDQPGEDPRDLPATPFGPGAPVFRRHETALLPFSYQRAWAHHKAGFHPFLVVDGASQTVHRMRAEGAAFRPLRMSSEDWDLWTMTFATRQIARLA